MKIPLISIITPTFNAAATIERALKSVAYQRFKDIEHLIIDGNSEDETLEIVHSYQKKYNHIRLISEKDEGIYHAINKGIDLIYGNWLFILGADDEFYNEQVLSDLVNDGIFKMDQVVYGNVVVKGKTPMSSDGSIYDGPFDLAKLLKKNICQQSIFYPRSTIKKNGYFTTRYRVCADWDYNLRCFAKQEFFYVDKIITIFSAGGKSTTEEDRKFSDDLLKNIVNYFNLDPGDEKLYDRNSPFFKIISRYLDKYQVTNGEIIEYNDENTGLHQVSPDEYSDLLIQKKNLIMELQDQVKYNNILIAFSKKQIRDLNSRLANLLKSPSTQGDSFQSLEDKIQKIYQSYTWRIGKIIMAPIQFVYKLIKR